MKKIELLTEPAVYLYAFGIDAPPLRLRTATPGLVESMRPFLQRGREPLPGAPSVIYDIMYYAHSAVASYYLGDQVLGICVATWCPREEARSLWVWLNDLAPTSGAMLPREASWAAFAVPSNRLDGGKEAITAVASFTCLLAPALPAWAAMQN